MFLFLSLNLSSAIAASVYVIPAKAEIEPGWLLFLERSLARAEADSNTRAVILEMDTPGGFIDTAQEAKRRLDDSPLSVYTYVNTNAISAGAYLALVTDGFFMTPGSTIGAAEPVILGGGEVSEKLLSFWEAEMRSTAEKQGKDPRIAAAMVRKEISIEGVVEEGKLLTLTTGEAEELNFSNGTVDSIEELLTAVDLAEEELIYTSENFWETISGWLINPVIATLLLMLGFFFLIVEIMTAGFGIGGFLSLLAFGLYFGGHFFTGISGWPALLMFVVGIVLLLVEAFMPGFGLFGLAGLVGVIVAIVLAAASTTLGVYMVLISFALAGVAGYLAYHYFKRIGALRNFILSYSATREQGYSTSRDYRPLLGKKGQAATPLRPSGAVIIDGKRYDTVSEGAYIQKDEPVKVVQVEGYRIVVRKIEQEK